MNEDSENRESIQPLDYAEPRYAEVSPAKMVLQAAVGWFGAVIVICITAFAAGYAGFAVGYDNDRAGAAILAVAGIGLTGIGVVIGAALSVRRDPRRSALQAGLWAGLACGLLIAGICFKTM